jgi:hypothetical protein
VSINDEVRKKLGDVRFLKKYFVEFPEQSIDYDFIAGLLAAFNKPLEFKVLNGNAIAKIRQAFTGVWQELPNVGNIQLLSVHALSKFTEGFGDRFAQTRYTELILEGITPEATGTDGSARLTSVTYLWERLCWEDPEYSTTLADGFIRKLRGVLAAFTPELPGPDPIHSLLNMLTRDLNTHLLLAAIELHHSPYVQKAAAIKTLIELYRGGIFPWQVLNNGDCLVWAV